MLWPEADRKLTLYFLWEKYPVISGSCRLYSASLSWGDNRQESGEQTLTTDTFSPLLSVFRKQPLTPRACTSFGPSVLSLPSPQNHSALPRTACCFPGHLDWGLLWVRGVLLSPVRRPMPFLPFPAWSLGINLSQPHRSPNVGEGLWKGETNTDHSKDPVWQDGVYRSASQETLACTPSSTE